MPESKEAIPAFTEIPEAESYRLRKLPKNRPFWFSKCTEIPKLPK
jgi:hypothetical protein